MSTPQRATELTKTIKNLSDALGRAKAELEFIQGHCRHVWGQVEYIPIHHEGYRDPGDPPGTMGVDRRLPCYVPPQTIKKWRRVCAECALEQATTCIKQVSISGPLPGTGGTAEIPDFGDMY